MSARYEKAKEILELSPLYHKLTLRQRVRLIRWFIREYPEN